MENSIQSGKLNYRCIFHNQNIVLTILANIHSEFQLKEEGIEVALDGIMMFFQWEKIPYYALKQLDCKPKKTTERSFQNW